MSLFLCTNLHLESDTKSDWETNDSKGFSSPVALQFSYASVSEMPEDYSISQWQLETPLNLLSGTLQMFNYNTCLT